MNLLKIWLEKGTDIKCGPTDGVFKTETAAHHQLFFFNISSFLVIETLFSRPCIKFEIAILSTHICKISEVTWYDFTMQLVEFHLEESKRM